MMIPISINVKESAYDKIIYFLSHFKDDVIIINKSKNSKPSLNDVLPDVAEFRALSRRISVVDKNIDILSLDKDINSDIF